MAAVLESLKDIAGVAGSFAVDDAGDVVANAMPAYVQLDDLVKVAPRIQWIVEAAAELRVENEWTIMHFSSYQLQVAPFAGGKLVIVTEPGVNARALRMAARILCRKLERMLDSTAEGTASTRSTLPPPAVSHAGETKQTVRTFEVRAQGRLAAGVAEPVGSSAELRNTQPSMPTPSVAKTSAPEVEVASPEARSSRRPASPRSMVYRGRRYDVG
jgi:predicted regulator of Ras-like GTPase activity (Roadblock/LC7/MglB family)